MEETERNWERWRNGRSSLTSSCLWASPLKGKKCFLDNFALYSSQLLCPVCFLSTIVCANLWKKMTVSINSKFRSGYFDEFLFIDLVIEQKFVHCICQKMWCKILCHWIFFSLSSSTFASQALRLSPVLLQARSSYLAGHEVKNPKRGIRFSWIRVEKCFKGRWVNKFLYATVFSSVLLNCVLSIALNILSTLVVIPTALTISFRSHRPHQGLVGNRSRQANEYQAGDAASMGLPPSGSFSDTSLHITHPQGRRKQLDGS